MDTTLRISGDLDDPCDESFMQKFVDSHTREFGFTIPDRSIVIDHIVLRGQGKSSVLADQEKTITQRTVFRNFY